MKESKIDFVLGEKIIKKIKEIENMGIDIDSIIENILIHYKETSEANNE